MSQVFHCKNHPGRNADNFCHFCQDRLCSDCLQEGPQHYYCHKIHCQRMLKAEVKNDVSLKRSTCPSCLKKIKNNPRFCPKCGYRLLAVTGDEKNDLATVARYGNAIEAHLARTKLESEGIQAFVADEHIISIDPFYDLGFGGVRLQVQGSQLQEALKVIQKVGGSMFVPPLWYALLILIPDVLFLLGCLVGYLFEKRGI